jgi:hypothetical protein
MYVSREDYLEAVRQVELAFYGVDLGSRKIKVTSPSQIRGTKGANYDK